MMKRMLIMLTLLVLFFGALFGWKTYVNAGLGEGSAGQFPPVTISATAARTETWTPALTAVGTLETEKGVNVTAQAPGIITALYFESGAEVGAGDLLVQQFIDDDLARLKALKAELRLAEITLQRAAVIPTIKLTVRIISTMLHSPMRAALRPPAVAGCWSSCQLPMLPVRAKRRSRRCTYDRRRPTPGVDCAAEMRSSKG